MKRVIADTNIFLRFILGDIPKQYKEAEALFKNAAHGKINLFIPQIIIFEIHFALEKYYGFKKNEITEKMKSLLSTDYFTIESKEIFLQTIELYRMSNLSFVDCFLLAKAQGEGAELFTFDKKLEKLKQA